MASSGWGVRRARRRWQNTLVENTFNEKQSCLSKLAVLAFDYGALDPKKSIGHVTKAVIIVADDKTDIDDKTDALTDWNEQPLINYRTDDPSSRKHWLKDGACRALIFKDKHGKSGYEMRDGRLGTRPRRPCDCLDPERPGAGGSVGVFF